MYIGLMMGALGDPGLNSRLFGASRRYAGDEVSLEHLRIADLPAFVPSNGTPEPVTAFRERIRALDGLLIFTTQHLNGVTGPIKNALDWIGTPTSVLERKPVALAGMASGTASTFASIQQVRSALTPLEAVVMRQPEYNFELSPSHFGEGDTIEDVSLGDELASFLTAARGFIAHELRAAKVESTPLNLPVAAAPANAADIHTAPLAAHSATPGLHGAKTGGSALIPPPADTRGMVANPRRFRT